MIRCVGVIALATLLAGCVPPPKQNGGVKFDRRGFAHRMRVLCHLGVGDPDAQAACAQKNAPKVGTSDEKLRLTK